MTDEHAAPLADTPDAPPVTQHEAPAAQYDDSTFGESDRTTISTSIKSSAQSFQFVHGRRWHAFEENSYWLPNDDIEINRLELQHICWKISLNGRLYLAPIPDDVHHIIDIGTGTGQWAIEFADSHPSASVIGTDLSPIQPSWLPTNCNFLIDDAEEEWVYDHKFDFIHSRMLTLGIHNWPRYFQQTWNWLKPGGWMEVQEVVFPVCHEGDVDAEAPMLKWSQYVRDAAAADNIDTQASTKFRKYLEDQGFVNIHWRPVKWPVGAWSEKEHEKRLGKLVDENTDRFVPPMVKLFTKWLDWTPEQYAEFATKVTADQKDPERKYYWMFNLYYAQKPEAAE
ncbi:S-adenosyl-L-methionine-dependent methyltransferase [Trichodelitschia bisporula]|uniref:S-adenosyl-L-methionine-dependent methyltransferase n=1 Tax=Trichodelitschia bisporula TaxID=703511 RepID=A0A6G1I3E8_9PEZI|nr:S-adenosyl-L-methionine-dependent methyltransferase [Trichodelitschia bisporula]